MSRKESRLVRAAYWIEDTVYDLTHRPKKNPPDGDTPARRDLIGAPLAEFIGTFAFVGVSVSVAHGAASKLSVAGTPLDSTAVALVFGLMLLAMVALFGERSGANFNPAITLALAVFKKMRWGVAVTYWIAQFAGALLGSWLLAHAPYVNASGSTDTGFGVAQPGAGVGPVASSWTEFVGTFLLTLVVAGVAVTRQLTATSVLAIGSVLTALVAFGGPLTGGAFNPARALGPMVTSGQFQDWLAYVIPPALGAIAAMGLHLKYFVRVQDPSA